MTPELGIGSPSHRDGTKGIRRLVLSAKSKGRSSCRARTVCAASLIVSAPGTPRMTSCRVTTLAMGGGWNFAYDPRGQAHTHNTVKLLSEWLRLGRRIRETYVAQP